MTGRGDKTQWFDVSVPLYGGMVHWPGDPEVVVDRVMKLEQGDPSNVTRIDMGAHTGTHMDAPIHFLEGGASLDALSFDAVIGTARIIEVTDQRAVEISDVLAADPKEGERILFKTRNSDVAWSSDRFFEEFVFIAPEAAALLVERRVQTVGIDYLSVESFVDPAARTHKTLLAAGIWIIEGLNLSATPAGDYDLICLPIRLKGADGAPARAIVRPR